MIKKTIGNLQLDMVADSGQCFRWKKLEEDTYMVPVGRKALIITCDCVHKDIAGGEFSLECSDDEWDSLWSSYLDMETDYQAIGDKILSSGDEYLTEAYRAGSGIRILRQDLWEVIISFIISQNNNIKRIKGSIEAFCDKAGLDQGGFNAFPYPNDIPEDFSFANLGLGYRDEYLENMYRCGRKESELLSLLPEKGYEEAREMLLGFKGIGPKVANCICLFGLHHVEAFPVDTHIKQILDGHYSQGFPFDRYEGVAGIVQQYMFYAKQKLGKQ